MRAAINTMFAFMLGIVSLAAPPAQGQSFSVIYSFTGSNDGANPLAGFIIDRLGNLYGTTNSGGNFGAGVVFELSSTGHEIVLHHFAGGTDGANPQSRLVADKAGNLYGTTYSGGLSNSGTVFEISHKGQESVLYSFKGGADGASPIAGLAIDKAGNLYGTTTAGGSSGNGTVFKLSVPLVTGGAWTEDTLYSFGTGTDGTVPVGGVTLDAYGDLYGTTSGGGAYGYGAVFQLKRSASTWTENILHDFAMGTDGGVPYSGLVWDAAGSLYGASTDGGGEAGSGGGTVFELTHTVSGWTFAVIYDLPGWGISGSFRNLLLSSGKIYATTHCDGAYDAGTVYELTQSNGTWTYNSLYVFTGGTDGLYSFSNLVADQAGNLYGTTNEGGANGLGDVFKVTP